MKLSKLSGIIPLFALLTLLVACEDETTTIGSVISTNEVIITVDTLTSQNLYGKAVAVDNFDSRTGNLMLGNIQSEKYGMLSTSFVTQLMCASNLQIPDSLFELKDFVDRVDSCKLLLGAVRTGIVGDSLAPQKLTVFKLTQQLPSNISSTFNPNSYYDPSMPFASKSYTVSEIASSDSLFYNGTFVDLSVELPLQFGRSIIETYTNSPEVFQWPQTMAKNFLPGLYVENSFGNGCIANITSLFVAVYYYSLQESKKEDEDGNTTVTVSHQTHMAIPFTVSPEVLSSNNISYIPSDYIKEKNQLNDGEVVVTTPGGYMAEFTFPAQQLIDDYRNNDKNLSTVNDLILYIPAVSFDDEAGIGVAQNMLMIKTSEYEEFFAKNKIPDNKVAFTGVYDAKNERYYFTSMRNYFLDLLEKGTLTEDDVTFTVVPVEITAETGNGYSNTTYVTKCVPYTAKPTMTLLKTNDATITFSYSTQLIK